jgi:CheY-like chemotaxis protein/HAMP domain-containing protein
VLTTFRARLATIALVTVVAFAALIVTGAMMSADVKRQLDEVRYLHLPRLQVGPQLEAEFERLGRALQDAVAAQDADAARATVRHKELLLAAVRAAGRAIEPARASTLAAAVVSYHDAALAVSLRLIQDESGEAIVEAMAAMQERQRQVSALIEASTYFDRDQLTRAFERAADAQETAAEVRLATGLVGMLLVLVLSVLLSRGLLDALGRLSHGFERFGKGDFDHQIPVRNHDEVGQVAEQANQMARNLARLDRETRHQSWIKAAQAGLVRDLQGELEPDETAGRAVAFLTRYLEAPAGAIYHLGRDGGLHLLGQPGGAAPARFAAGEGLIGQAARSEDIVVVSEPPADYLRVRSGLGESPPRALALVPLLRSGRVIGVLELAFFRPVGDDQRELLASLQETLGIKLEVARARAETRALLEETQALAARLTEQDDELRASNEELQTQQEELRLANEELAAQAGELMRRGQALEDKATELAQVSTYKSQFLTNMSHELRTPLNSMLLLSNLLAENVEHNLSEKQVEYCRAIHSSGRDLLGLINQLLDLAKIESGKQELRLGPVRLDEIAAHARRTLEPLAQDKGLAFTVELAPDLPASITSDGRRIEQMVVNLLGNAIKFTERGEVKLRIARARADARVARADLDPARAIVLEISDTGPGIAPEYQQRIFAPFEQLEAAADRRYGGTGLGLAITRELAQLLGGELRLESTPGQGSTFICTLPMETRAPGARPSETPAAERKPAVPDDRSSLAPGDPHLLLIEDDLAFARAFSEVVHAHGLKCLIAHDGKTGLELAREHHPTGIILDVGLPDIEGFELMRRLRADQVTASIPVHFVSAFEGKERGLDLGAVGYLTKPASKSDLIQVIDSLVSGARPETLRLLVVGDAETGTSLSSHFAGEPIKVDGVTSAAAALEAIGRERYACMILDPSLPDMDGLDLLERIQARHGASMPTVVVYTSRALSKAEATRLEAYAEAIVLKEGKSLERVLGEVKLFVRRVREGVTPRRVLPPPRARVQVDLTGRKILLVDDDMRTVFALSANLRAKGALVTTADTGQAALDALARDPEIDAVLMDIMMPEMDGYEAMRRIRQDQRFHDLPIIALTAKAMKNDEEKCLEAGATDYLSKPIDVDQLQGLLASRLRAPGDHVEQ